MKRQNRNASAIVSAGVKVLTGVVILAASPQSVMAGTDDYVCGLLLYQTEYPSQEFHIRDLLTGVVTDVPLPTTGDGYYNPQWCRTGEWITFMCSDAAHNSQVCISRPDGSEFAQLTTGSGNYVTPGFSGDCSRVVFHGVYGHTYVINRDGSAWMDLGVSLGHTRWSPVDNRISGTDWGFTYQSDIFIFDMDEGTTAQITYHPSGGYFNYAAWSPDGSKLAVAGGIHGGSNDIFVMNADGSDLVNVTDDLTESEEGWPSWSSGGNWLIYDSYASGDHDVWAMRPDGTNRTNLTNTPDQNEFVPAIASAREADSDGDCVPDTDDNCPDLVNANQADSDDDGVGDACDSCPDDPNKIEARVCGCDVADDIDFVGFLPPIDGADSTGGSFANPLRAFKLGSTVPVKFVASQCGEPLYDGVHTLAAIKYSSAVDSDSPIDATPTDAATSGNQFRLADGEWHFNLSTRTGFSQGTWKLIATLSDGSTHEVWITIKK